MDGSGDVHLFANLRGQRAAGGAFAGRTSLFFNALTNQLEAARLGAGYQVHPAAAAADLDGDGRPELLIGTESGGLLSYGAHLQGLAARAPAALPTPSFGFDLYPNPARDEATLTLPAPARVEVLDLAGRRIRTAALPAGRQALSLRGLAAGLYLLRATTADGRAATRRLAVE